jgi:hypothetical protein
MKRSREELIAEIDECEQHLKRARRELADHADTLEEELPDWLLDRFVRCTPRKLHRFYSVLVEDVDSKLVAAGTLEIFQDLWTCDVHMEGQEPLEIESGRWGTDTFEVPGELDWLESEKDHDSESFHLVDWDDLKGTWNRLMERASQRADLVLAGLAFAALRDGQEKTLRQLFAHVPASEGGGNWGGVQDAT